MNVEESLQRYGMLPAERGLPAIRAILAREAEIERSGGEREEDPALLCYCSALQPGLVGRCPTHLGCEAGRHGSRNNARCVIPVWRWPRCDEALPGVTT